jgi:prolyl-tRNA editing enzyme YbaK/EbsC (Cys-tRNA(Pro) deacylase)
MDTSEELHPNSVLVVEAARAAGVEVDVLRFPDGTRTAEDAAGAIGCDVGAIVKSLVLASAAGPVIALVSGRNRVDYAKVAAALGVEGVHRAGAEAARAATGFPIGGTAPFGHPRPLPMVLDRDLLALGEVWAAAGTPDTVFAIPAETLATATGAVVADVAEGTGTLTGRRPTANEVQSA